MTGRSGLVGFSADRKELVKGIREVSRHLFTLADGDEKLWGDPFFRDGITLIQTLAAIVEKKATPTCFAPLAHLATGGMAQKSAMVYLSPWPESPRPRPPSRGGRTGRPTRPPWLGDERVHSSHRANLLRKKYAHYSQFGWKETPVKGYYWPRAS